MNDEKYEIPSEIYNLARELYDMYKIMYKKISPDVDYILSQNSKNVGIIERTLDALLEIPTDEAYEAFVSICKHYMQIDKETAQSYLDFYNELYGEDEEETKTKKKTISD